MSNNTKYSEAQIEVIKSATAFYQIEEVLAAHLGVEPYQVPSIEIEPLLGELAENAVFDGIDTSLPPEEIISTVNKVYGNIIYLTYYDETGKGDKSVSVYEEMWGDLLKTLYAKATTSEEFWTLGDAGLEKFTAFEDKDELNSFVNNAFENAIDLSTSIFSLTSSVWRFESEYYFNEELLAMAGEKALELANTFEDYSLICYNDNEERRFPLDIFERAVNHMASLINETNQEEIERIISLLNDDDEVDYINKLNSNRTTSAD